MSAARRELYVYYRVAQPQWREAAGAVIAWQLERRRAHPGLDARLLRRPDARDDAITLMEAYAGIGTAALETELAQGASALRQWLIGERHIERFDALD